MTVPSARVRSIYRRLLREMPTRSPSLLANPSHIQRQIRADLASSSTSTPQSELHMSKPPHQMLEEAEQFIHYLRAQRTYIALLERYNPGINLGDQERLRLTARRVGMEMPAEVSPGASGGKK